VTEREWMDFALNLMSQVLEVAPADLRAGVIVKFVTELVHVVRRLGDG
jgi:hypothetical protein